MGKVTGKNPGRRNAKGQIIGSVRSYNKGDAIALFIKYLEYVSQHPRYETVVNLKTGDAVRVERERPLSWEGFYCWLRENGFASLKHYRDARTRNNYPELLEELDYINDKINEDNFTGAAVGIYNANLIARLIEARNELSANTNVQGHDLPIPVFKLAQG